MSDRENTTKARDDGRDGKGLWQKGISGNPGGRPAAPFSIRRALREYGEMKRTVTVDGKKKVLTNLEALVLQVWSEAIKGNHHAWNFISRINQSKFVKHGGTIKHTLEIERDYSKLSEKELDELEKLLAQAEVVAAAGGNGNGRGSHL